MLVMARAGRSALAHYLENWTDRPLVNRAGIKGLFHIETKGWLPAVCQTFGGLPPSVQ